MPAPAASQLTFTSAPTTATFSGSDNHSHIEFEAPASAELDLEQRLQLAQDRANHGGKGRFSIDLSLELERQLNSMESPPITPLYNATTHPTKNGKHEVLGEGANLGELAPDPEILAHIITQLRHSLTEMTKERDDLIKMLATANAEEAFAKDALQHMTDKATEAGEELVAARKKLREEGDQIVMLRAKVEESRRGLMRLQTENRRQSMAPIDVSRASNLGLSPFGSPASSKRQSFAPLTGSMQGRQGHRRISSVSDTNFGSFPTPDFIPSPNSQTSGRVSPEACTSAPPTSARFPGLLGRPSPPDTEIPLPPAEPIPGPSTGPPYPAITAELDILKKELKSVKDQLDIVKHELIEVNEAKEASDICVKTLRDFIGENNVGATPAGGASEAVKLPPLPSMTTGEEAELKRAPAPIPGSGWGFKLWGVDSPKLNVPQSASVAQLPALDSAPISPSSATAVTAVPISRKLGGFFSSRSSVSSMSSQQPQLPHLQTNAASTGDSMHSLSDTSSATEPFSPCSDMHGLDTTHYTQARQETVVVRDVTNLSHVQTHRLDVETQKLGNVDGVPLPVSATDIDGLR